MFCSFHLSYHSVYFHIVVLAHAVPGECLDPNALTMLTAPAWVWPSSPQGLGCWVTHWNWSGLDSHHSPPPVPDPRPMFAPQFCFPAGLSTAALVSPYSRGAGSPGISCRSCEAGGGLGRLSGAAETAGCCY